MASGVAGGAALIGGCGEGAASDDVGAVNCLNVRDFGARGDGSTDDSEAAARGLEALSGRGGGVLFFPPGSYRLAIEVPDAVQVVGTPRTTLQPRGPRSVVVLSGTGSALREVRVVGGRPDDPREGLTAHCIEVRGSNVALEGVSSGGGRYDSVYVRGGEGLSFRRCRFLPSARNTCSVVKGSQIAFQDCSFHQDGSVSSREFSGLYLYDIEPNPGDEVYDVSHIRCSFQNDLADGYGGVILHARGDALDNAVLFYRCRFLHGERTATVIRPMGGRVYRGLTLIENEFDGGVLMNARPIQLTDSVLFRNRHHGTRFAYNVELDEVAVLQHEAGGWRGFQSTGGTVAPGISSPR